jgi:hypothetical protein
VWLLSRLVWVFYGGFYCIWVLGFMWVLGVLVLVGL